MAELTELLAAARLGQQGAVDALCAVLYDDLRRLARARLRAQQRDTMLDTSALVHESYLRLVQMGQVAVVDRVHFMGYAGRVMRSVIVDFVRKKQAQRRGGDQILVTLNTDIVSSLAATEDDLIRINDALDELATVDPRLVQVVELRYFVGLEESEVALALGVSERTVRRDWEKARLLLQTALT
ncbi:MAG: ECF-type sigma factor [Rhodoferax sp.]